MGFFSIKNSSLSFTFRYVFIYIYELIMRIVKILELVDYGFIYNNQFIFHQNNLR